jgi:hypothetical protein
MRTRDGGGACQARSCNSTEAAPAACGPDTGSDVATAVLKAFRKAVTKPAADGDHVRQSVEAYWARVRHPMFVASFELAVAARSDKELALILRPAQETFEREWHQAAVNVFPEWRGRGEKFDLALDLSRYVLEGISFLTHKETERDQRVISYLDEKIRELAGLTKSGSETNRK